MKRNASLREFRNAVNNTGEKPVSKELFYDALHGRIVCRFFRAGVVIAESITQWFKGDRRTEYFVEENAQLK